MTAADDAEIRNLIARFAEATDVGTLEEYAACLAETATMVIGDAMTRTGRTEIVAAMASSRTQGTFGPGSGSIHVVGASIVDVDGDDASASTSFLFVVGGAGQPQVAGTGRYADAFERAEAGWQLSQRTIHLVR